MIDQPLLGGSGRSRVILRFSAALTLVTIHTQHLICGGRRHVFLIGSIQNRLITSMKAVAVPGEGRAESRTNRQEHSLLQTLHKLRHHDKSTHTPRQGGGAVGALEDWLNPV